MFYLGLGVGLLIGLLMPILAEIIFYFKMLKKGRSKK